MEDNIENVLLPERNQLVDRGDGVFTAEMLDAELDQFSCEFNGDDTVTIDTKRVQYLMLTRENLEILLNLMDEVNER